MANYSIVLNLRGSAVTNSKKLADNLERADKAAKSLKGNLQGMPNVPTGGRGGYYGGVGGGRPTYGSSMGNGLVSSVTTLSTQSGLGTVFRFAGQLNTALAVTDAIFRTAAQAIKIGAKFNIMAYTGGAQLLNKGAQILTSSQMGEGIRLLQRRQQARLGFGAGYAEAQERADLLAASYGLDPSNVIASMNVLAGMKVGGRKISTAQAERLTQVGGLIAQQSGMSFETVMINIQQMMSQAVPSMRDIRQLLTHAPILGRYALQEMEKKGITGMTAMEYLKADKGGLMAVFERYLSENPSLLSMRARGVVQRANTGFFANLAQNEKWLMLADKYSEVVEKLSSALSTGLTRLAQSPEIVTSVNRFVVLLENAPSAFSSISNFLERVIRTANKILGIDSPEARQRTDAERAVRGYVGYWVGRGGGTFSDIYREKGWTIPKDPNLFIEDVMNRLGVNLLPYVRFGIPYGDDRFTRAVAKARAAGTPENYMRYHSTDAREAGYWLTHIKESPIYEALQNMTGGNMGLLTALSGGGAGEAISGYGSDRKSLVINFNAPIVEWDSTINADDPQDVVNTVSETIEGAASRAIQIALLGATGTMSSRY